MEDALQKEFAKCKKELLLEEEKLARREKVIMQNLEALQEKQKAGVMVSDIILYDRYIKQISIDRDRNIHRIIELKNQLRQKMSALVEAMKDRKILDRLKEKELETYRRELDRKEQILMSEIAVSGFNLRKQPQ
ncbi:MAG: flagellar export protein FliJ [Deltaproteobacteria bacterium]|nr:flagellar export protein FliJ [Deltaproteobacteria bacterium]